MGQVQPMHRPGASDVEHMPVVDLLVERIRLFLSFADDAQ
jgi:hypothetical protein